MFLGNRSLYDEHPFIHVEPSPMSQPETVQDIAIVGAGLAGLIQFRALQARGFDPYLLDPRPEQALRPSNSDTRSTALTAHAVELLGLPKEWLHAHGQQIAEMVVDGGVGSSLRLDASLHLASGAWVVANGDLNRFLLDQIEVRGAFGQAVVSSAREGGYRVLKLADGETVKARLVIAADGRDSQLRRDADIQAHVRDFHQTALTGRIEHSQPHQGRAFQRFLPGGTLAFLPLCGTEHASSFIWVEPSTKAKGLFALSPEILAVRMQARFGHALGDLKPPAEPASAWGQFPLRAHHCETIVGDRLALIGEAAHSMHPLAGQGLNMTIKDVAALTAVLVDQRRHGLDAGDIQALQDYQRARRADTARFTALTTGLHDLLDRGPAPVRALAATGMGLIERLPPVKAFLRREADR